MQIKSWGSYSQWCLKLGLEKTDLVSGSHGLTPASSKPPLESIAHIPFGGMAEHWKSENTCRLKYRQFNRESKRHAPKQSKTRNMDRQMFQVFPRREGSITWSGYLEGQITITLHDPCFFPQLLCANMMPYVQWSIPVVSWV